VKVHLARLSNASVNGLVNLAMDGWDERVLSALELDSVMLPRLVDTMGSFGVASALTGAPRSLRWWEINRPRSLVSPVFAVAPKITFGTAALLDMVQATKAPRSFSRPRRAAIRPSFVVATPTRPGLEGIILSAGACVEWLLDLGLISTPSESEHLANSSPRLTASRSWPALSGLGTPQWDFGARGAFLD